MKGEHLSNHEKEYIENSTALTIHQVSVSLNRSFNIVKRYVVKKKLPYELQAKGRKPAVKSIIRYHKPAVIIQLQRPPAQYSNTDWDEYFNKQYGTK